MEKFWEGWTPKVRCLKKSDSPKRENMVYLYLLRLSDDSIYCGITKNPRKRMKQHRQGRGSKYVKGRLPFELVYLEKHENRRKAMQKEAEVKKWSKSRKEELIENSEDPKL